MKGQLNNLLLTIEKEGYYEILENPDNGFGFKATIKDEWLSELQMKVLVFLHDCCTDGLLGNITLRFDTHALGEVNEIIRHCEKIVRVEDGWEISNTY